nr:hypothetical protein [Lentilactobacillus kisonensis]
MDSIKNEVKTYPAYLTGEWQASNSQETIAIKSPWKHEVIGNVQAVTQSEVDESIEAAKLLSILGQSFH